MHLTPSWVHVRFTDPYGLFATDSDEHYNSLCDMGSQVLDKGHTVSPEFLNHCLSTLRVCYGWRCLSHFLLIQGVFLHGKGLKPYVRQNY